MEQTQGREQSAKHKGRLIKHQTLTESRARNKPSARHMDVLIGLNNVIHSFKSKHTLSLQPRASEGLAGSYSDFLDRA